MPHELPILLATSNRHKLHEVAAVLRPAGVELAGLDSLAVPVAEPIEDQPTFEANALLKARYYARATKRLCLADDSGLEVDALDGAPGVLSARYAGADGPRPVIDQANNARLLDELSHVPDAQRTARFVCVMALCDAKRTLVVVRGAVEGVILTKPRGTSGFGYDPLFYLPDPGVSVAELTCEQKNAISHRGQAARLMLAELTRLGLAR